MKLQHPLTNYKTKWFLIFAEKDKQLRDMFKRKCNPKYLIDTVEDMFAVADGNLVVTSYNPHFTMAGGIDTQIAKKYSQEVEQIRAKYKYAPVGTVERIGNVIFAVTVDNNIKPDREAIKKVIWELIRITGERKKDDTFKVVLWA